MKLGVLHREMNQSYNGKSTWIHKLEYINIDNKQSFTINNNITKKYFRFLLKNYGNMLKFCCTSYIL